MRSTAASFPHLAGGDLLLGLGLALDPTTSSSAAGGTSRSCDAASLAAVDGLDGLRRAGPQPFSARSALRQLGRVIAEPARVGDGGVYQYAVIFRISSFRALAASNLRRVA